MRFLVALFAIAFVAQSQAVELTFKFEVHSSGPDIYACNAGIRHKNSGDRVCRIEGTDTPCNPSDCSGKKACDHNCQCTGIRGGSYRMDYLSAKYGYWDSKSTPTAVSVSSDPKEYKKIFSDVNAWKYRIDNLSFMLGSELYGAEYFVDICYRGPQINYDVAAPHSFFAQTTAQDFNVKSGTSYLDSALIVTKIEYVCDLQHEGDIIGWDYADHDSIVNEAIFGAGDKKGPTTYFAPILGTGVILKDTINDDKRAPRFCKVRYYYKESALKTVRGWKYHGGKFCTHTRIEEDDPGATGLN